MIALENTLDAHNCFWVHRNAIIQLRNRFGGRPRTPLRRLLTSATAVGRAGSDGYQFPLTQGELAQCLGLTLVHANRTIQELRRRQLVELENRQLRILDRAGLEDVADFDPAYLYLEQLPI